MAVGVYMCGWLGVLGGRTGGSGAMWGRLNVTDSGFGIMSDEASDQS